jgi:2-phospho-L-lactate guanylyltransferase
LSTPRRTVERIRRQWKNLHSMSQPPSDRPHAETTAWHLVLPVKRAALGKSRLAESLDRTGRPAGCEALSRALASDTVRAARLTVGADRVLVVTSDEVFAAACGRQGVRVIEDPGLGLNAAVAAGLAAAHGDGSAAALLADLPALTSAELAEALAAAAVHEQAFVPDAQNTGTVLRTALDPHFIPRFGPASAARHEADGAARLELSLPRLRTDVDDLESLGRAAELGLGPATLEVLGALDLLGWAHAGDGPRV